MKQLTCCRILSCKFLLEEIFNFGFCFGVVTLFVSSKTELISLFPRAEKSEHFLVFFARLNFL